MNHTILEKSPVKEYAIEQAKKYEFEKNLQKSSNHIFMKKESEFVSVNRVIKNYAKRSAMEFDTIFKLYKLQNYSFSPQYFEGSSYKYGSLTSFMNFVKIATMEGRGSFSTTSLTTFKLITSFINDIKGFSKPFPYIFNEAERKKHVSDLINSGTLTKEEEEFINSRISARKPEASLEERSYSKDRIKRKVKEMKDTTVKKSKRNFLSEQDFMTIVNNYKLGSKVVQALLPTHNKQTIANYVRSCIALESGQKLKSICPTELQKCFSNVKNQTVPVSTSPVVKPVNVNNEKFVLLNDKEDIIKASSSLDFLRGYLEACLDKSLKLYKLTEL